jgi:hypothetical protein
LNSSTAAADLRVSTDFLKINFALAAFAVAFSDLYFRHLRRGLFVSTRLIFACASDIWRNQFVLEAKHVLSP